METSEWVTGKIVLKIGGEPLEMEMTVPATPVKPQRMLPVFQQMSNSFVDMGVKAVEAEGEKISCKAGCGACCSQPVPISKVEVYNIAELVENIPEPRKNVIKKRFTDAFEHFSKIGWFEKMQALTSSPPKDPKEQKQAVVDLGLEYFREGISCPFLENGSCSIYESRPLACREYLVTSPAENCSNPTAKTVSVIDLLIKPSTALRFLGREADEKGAAVVPLIRSLDFVENNPESFDEKPGEKWVADFFGQLTRSEIPDTAPKPVAAG